MNFEKCNVNLLIDAQTRQWSLSKIQQFMIPQQRPQVLATPIWFSRKQDDYCWKFTSNGMFNVKSAYLVVSIVQSNIQNWPSENGDTFSLRFIKEGVARGNFNHNENLEVYQFLPKLLSLDTPTKVQLLVWKILRDAFPLNAKRARMINVLKLKSYA